METIQPKKIEKRLIYLQSRDGILDMFFGGMLMAAALNDTFTFYEWPVPWYIRFLIIILMIPAVLAKIIITVPRMGYVKMKPVSGGRKQTLMILTGTAVILTLLIILFSILKVPWLNAGNYAPGPIYEMIFLVLVFGIIGWLMGLYTLIAVGIILAFAWPVSTMIGLDSIGNMPADPFTLGIPGLIITLIGIIELIRFMKRYPRQNLNANYEQE